MKTNNLNIFIINLLKENLKKKEKVKNALVTLKKNPELITLLLRELDASIDKLNRYIKTNKNKYKQILINSEYLRLIIPKDKSLPTVDKMIEDIRNAKLIFKEVNRFNFINKLKSEMQIIKALILGIYRTYILIKYPYLREKNAQIASSLEEMLALMALQGINTNLFQATKHWILEYKKEGFSKDLAKRIIKY